MIDQRICIVGLGLMGGSLALALRDKTGYIIGVDRHAATRQQALAEGAVDLAVKDLAIGLAEADIMILATPVRTILSILRELPTLRPDGCHVFDLGSTKLAINEAMSKLPESFAALGGHPMCGKEMAGYKAADPDLFQGRTFILTRNQRSTEAIEELVLEILDVIGAKPLFLSATHHDQLTATVSHLPYLASAALMRFASEQEDATMWETSASGFRDVSRLAGSDPHMLLDILLTNKAAVLEQLQTYTEKLATIKQLLSEEDEEALADWLSNAQRDYIAYRQAIKALESNNS
jgi:prephenate dehydrogenase